MEGAVRVQSIVSGGRAESFGLIDGAFGREDGIFAADIFVDFGG